MINATYGQLIERKSVRVYEERPILEKEKKMIIEAAIEAPTAGNMTLYSIIDVTSQELKDQLAVTCDHQPFIAKAPMVLIFCADYKRWYDTFCEFETEVRKPAEGDLFLAMEDCMVAAQNSVIAAQSLGIGSCYIGDILENYEIHAKLLKLPQYVLPIGMLCFGYPSKHQSERLKPKRFNACDIVHENEYSAESHKRQAQMLQERMGKSEEEMEEWIKRFCQRKWNCDFSREMSRSVSEMIKAWKK